jgi:hypothetical protein
MTMQIILNDPKEEAVFDGVLANSAARGMSHAAGSGGVCDIL